jgi:hypothetical protein
MEKTFSPSMRTLILAATIVLLACFPARADLVTNGSFEAVQISTSFSNNPAEIPGWTHTGDPGDALLINATFPQMLWRY